MSRSSPSASGRERRRSPDEARLIERFKRLAPQRAALKLAFTYFVDEDGHFDRAAWSEAFDSEHPNDIRNVKAATGLYEGLVNHLVEMLHTAARLRGLDIAIRAERASGPELFDAVASDEGLTASQVTVLKRLYAMRNELQHASPGVEAGEVYDHLVLLDKTLPRFARSYVDWLKRHDVSLL